MLSAVSVDRPPMNAAVTKWDVHAAFEVADQAEGVADPWQSSVTPSSFPLAYLKICGFVIASYKIAWVLPIRSESVAARSVCSLLIVRSDVACADEVSLARALPLAGTTRNCAPMTFRVSDPGRVNRVVFDRVSSIR